MPDSPKREAAIVLSCGSMAGKKNLHSLWDTALVELEQGTPTEIALRIQAAVNDDDRQWQHCIRGSSMADYFSLLVTLYTGA